MSKSVFETVDELVNRVNASGCRVVMPYATPSPLTLMFDGGFSGAEYIPSYPSTLHIFGVNGHIAVSGISSIEHVRDGRYVVNFGDPSQPMDLMVKISE